MTNQFWVIIWKDFLNYVVSYHLVRSRRNDYRCRTCSWPNTQVINLDYCCFTGGEQVGGIIHHIKSLRCCFGLVFVRLDVVKYPQGSNQMVCVCVCFFNVKGKPMHCQQSIKRKCEEGEDRNGVWLLVTCPDKLRQVVFFHYLHIRFHFCPIGRTN